MDKNAVWKWLILFVITAFSLVTVTPPEKKIRKGLDLAGGTSFTVQIDQERLRSDMLAADPGRRVEEIDAEIAGIMKDADARTVEVLRNRIDSLGVNEPLIAPGKDHRILIQLPGADPEQRAKAEKSIKDAAFLQFRLAHKDNARLTDNLFNANKVPEGYTIVEAGSRKYYARTKAYDELIKDPGYARRLASFEQPDPSYVFMLQPEKLRDGREVYTPCFVRIRAEMTGETLKRADVERDAVSGEVHVALTFKPKGANEFAKITSYYAPHGQRNKESEVGRQLAIVLDNTLYSAPTIREPIPSGRAVISGSFNMAEAALLRNILNAGSLPAPVKILEKRMVDASLGRDAIRSGVTASLIGGALVVLFMLIYYAYCGLIANIALIANMILLPAGMILVAGVFGFFVRDAGVSAKNMIQLPVLTMPGIAGIVLTIGMAVDANVLIFERMREEFRAGKSARAAVTAGYDRAFLAIFDSNLTTLLTGVILFIFGSGPIRGFAITLSAGIVVSMYTALVLTRMIFDATVPEMRVKPYRMLQLVRDTKIDFLAKRQVAITFSAAVIVLTLGLFATRLMRNPRQVMAIDFTGGSVLSYSVENEPAIEDMRAALKAAGVDDAIIQSQGALEGVGDKVLQVKTGKEAVNGVAVAEVATAGLQHAFPDAKLTLTGEEVIGSQIGSDLKRDAFWAILIALIGMVVYITIRFEFGFALGALVALAHDVLITLGVFTLLDRQVSLTVVACLLTIVGYSVNDTIVIFDRIREDMKLNQRMPFRDLCNLSINQTLSRTLLTSLTTLLATGALFLFGGGAINDFALCMLIGLVAGVYSTVFIATPVMLAWYGNRRPGVAAAAK
ncbi:MAG: protein translocase subunit SecD [Kiritimatiellae bacterium]|nr:protein translocase subunit SecD [Kiritimatiellia bacterium]